MELTQEITNELIQEKITKLQFNKHACIKNFLEDLIVNFTPKEQGEALVHLKEKLDFHHSKVLADKESAATLANCEKLEAQNHLKDFESNFN